MVPSTVQSNRDIRFDSLRGLMLVFMTVNHLPSILRPATDESIGLFSAAEGFIFLSGLLAGLVYTRRALMTGFAAMHRAARKRATLIYRWQVGAFLVALVLVRVISHVWGFCSESSPLLFYSHPIVAALLGASLLHQPGLFDFLPMYCALVLALPYALRALQGGHRLRVLAISFSLWLASQWAPPIDGAPLYPVHVGSFNLFAWQLLFFLGVVIGHARATDSRPLVPFRPVLVAASLSVAVYGWGIQHLGWRPPWPDHVFGVSLNKPNLGGLRLVNFAVVAYLVAVVGVYFPTLLKWRPLAFLGRDSLAIVATQSIAVMILLEFPSLFATTIRNVLTTLATIGLLFGIAGLHKAIQRKPAASAGEAPPLDARQTEPLPVTRQHDARAA